MKGKRILVAEDDVFMREFLQELLPRKGHRVDVVADGQQAIESMRQTEYDLILSDIQMPYVDGLQVLEKALCMQPNTRVILMSGDTAACREEAKRRGAFDFIEKPFGVEVVEAKVELALMATELQAQKLAS